jgi:uncharacterized protein DUF5681
MKKEPIRDEKTTYEVGYRRPPKRTQFKPGRSGNPKGRPKGTLNIATVIERALREKVSIQENGKSKTVNKLEAAVMQLSNKAVAGDLKAFQLLTVFVRYAQNLTAQDAPNLASDEIDDRIVLGILERMGSTEGEDTKNANETISE